MRKVASVATVILSVIFCAVMLTIIGAVLLADGGEYSINQSRHLVLIILLALFLVVAIIGSYKLIVKKPLKISRKKELLIVGGIMTAITAFGVCVAYFLHVRYSWDPNELYWVIESLLNGNEEINNLGYASHFPFQMLFVFISVGFMAILNWFGLGLSIPVMWTGLNLILILATFGFLYLILRKLFSVQVGVYGLVLAFIFTPLILFVPIPYTDTFSLCFVTTSFYLFLFLIDKKYVGWRLCVLSALFALSVFLAFNLKATAGILVIAMAIYLLINFEKLYLKRFGVISAVFLLVFVPVTLLYKFAQSEILIEGIAIPKTHWVMMGLKNDKNAGGWDLDDWALTYEMEAARVDEDTIREVHVEKIKERLDDYGLFGYLEFLTKKISYTWGDGTYTASEQVAKQTFHSNSLMYSVFGQGGKLNGVYKAVINAFALAIYIILLWGGIVTLRNKDIPLLLKTAIVGLFIFLLFWETTSRYLINYTPILIVLAIYMVDGLNKTHVPLITGKIKQKMV